MLLEDSSEPSGLRMAKWAAKQPGKVEPVTCRLACWPVVPWKVKSAACPGVLMVTVAAVPGVTGPETFW